MKIGFDNEKYLETQSQHIRDRIAKFGDKLYLEFGGKLFDDYHASRVLPGFKPDSKLQMLMQLKDEAEIVIVINADDIEKNKVRGDLGITYDLDVLRLIDIFRGRGLYVTSVVLTRFADQPSAVKFEQHLTENGVSADVKYLFVGNELVAIRVGYDTWDISFQQLEADLTAKYGPAAATVDLNALGNGIFAVDDDGRLERRAEAFVSGNVMIVLEQDGDDIDLTYVDLSAAYIK